MPTAAYYGGGYPSGEMKVIIKANTKVYPLLTLPPNVHLELARFGSLNSIALTFAY
jgi:hypothetical protein